MVRRKWAVLLLALLAGCSRQNALPVSGDEMIVWDDERTDAVGWHEVQGEESKFHDLFGLSVGTKVRFVEANRLTKLDRVHSQVLILEGPTRGQTAYFRPDQLRPLPPK